MGNIKSIAKIARGSSRKNMSYEYDIIYDSDSKAILDQFEINEDNRFYLSNIYLYFKNLPLGDNLVNDSNAFDNEKEFRIGSYSKIDKSIIPKVQDLINEKLKNINRIAIINIIDTYSCFAFHINISEIKKTSNVDHFNSDVIMKDITTYRIIASRISNIRDPGLHLIVMDNIYTKYYNFHTLNSQLEERLIKENKSINNIIYFKNEKYLTLAYNHIIA